MPLGPVRKAGGEGPRGGWFKPPHPSDKLKGPWAQQDAGLVLRTAFSQAALIQIHLRHVRARRSLSILGNEEGCGWDRGGAGILQTPSSAAIMPAVRRGAPTAPSVMLMGLLSRNPAKAPSLGSWTKTYPGA